MLRRFAVVAVASAIVLSACQSMNMGTSRVSIDGDWVSGDGISVSTLRGGSLMTRFVDTNELLAQGTYTVQGNQATMSWVSIRSQENRSATCVQVSAAQMSCNSPDGQNFVLNRVG